MFRSVFGAICNFLLRIFYPIKIYGRENISDEKFLIIANHGHLLDPFLINIAVKMHFFVIGKMELFKIPVLKNILTWADVFPVDRNQMDLHAIKTSIAKLKESSLLLFPEGTRNGTLYPLDGKSGAIMMAAQAKVRILPVVLVGNYKFFQPLEVYILPPREVGEFGFTRMNSHAYKIIINELLGDIYSKLREETSDN